MNDLLAKLEDAIGKIETIAKACVAMDWRIPYDGYIVDRDVDGWRSVPDESRIFSYYHDREAEAIHAVNNDPDRVLRRIARDRKLLERHKPVEQWSRRWDDQTKDWVQGVLICTECSYCWQMDPNGDYDNYGAPRAWPCDDVRDLAEDYEIEVES